MKKIIIFLLIITAIPFNTFAEVKKVNAQNILTSQKYSAIFGVRNPIENMQPWIDKQKVKTIECRGWGCNERTLPKFPVTYNPILVVGEYQKDDVPWVMLKADYEITITDLTEQYEAEQATIAARELEISQIKQAINLIDESDKPAWEKKVLKRLVLELKD